MTHHAPVVDQHTSIDGATGQVDGIGDWAGKPTWQDVSANHHPPPLIQMMMKRPALLQRPLPLKLRHTNIPHQSGAFDTSSLFRGGIPHIKAMHFPGSVQFVHQNLPRLTKAIKWFRPVQLHTMTAQKIIALLHPAGANTDFFAAVETDNRNLAPCTCFRTGRTCPRRVMLLMLYYITTYLSTEMFFKMA
jgi:hypothetical protein